MEVGIEDCLHIEFEYNRSRYHLRDCVVGKIYFLLVGLGPGTLAIGISHHICLMRGLVQRYTH